MIAKRISSNTKTQSRAIYHTSFLRDRGGLIPRRPQAASGVSGRAWSLTTTDADVFPGVVCATATAGLRDTATEHVKPRRGGREDPEQARVDVVRDRGAQAEAHHEEDEDQEFTGQEERFGLARVRGAGGGPACPRSWVTGTLRSRHVASQDVVAGPASFHAATRRNQPPPRTTTTPAALPACRLRIATWSVTPTGKSRASSRSLPLGSARSRAPKRLCG